MEGQQSRSYGKLCIEEGGGGVKAVECRCSTSINTLYLVYSLNDNVTWTTAPSYPILLY